MQSGPLIRSRLETIVFFHSQYCHPVPFKISVQDVSRLENCPDFQTCALSRVILRGDSKFPCKQLYLNYSHNSGGTASHHLIERARIPRCRWYSNRKKNGGWIRSSPLVRFAQARLSPALRVRQQSATMSHSLMNQSTGFCAYLMPCIWDLFLFLHLSCSKWTF